MSDDSLNKPAAHTKEPATKTWGILGAIGFGALAFIVPQLAISGLMPFLSVALPFTTNVQNFVLMALLEGLTILAIMLIVRAYGHNLRSLGLGIMQWKYIWWALGGLIVYLALTIAISWIASLISPINFDEVQNVGFVSPTSIELLWVFVGLVILPPLAEELLFRGFMFKGLRSKMPFWLTAIIVSILFAFAHGQWNVGLDVFALSLVLCYLREKTNSLWPGIILHGLKNAMAFFVLFVYTGPK